MKTKIEDLFKTDHENQKQWAYGITDSKLRPVVKKIEKTWGDQKKIVFVMPSYLKLHGIMRGQKNIMILILRGARIVTLYFSDRPNRLFKKEKEAEFQVIY